MSRVKLNASVVTSAVVGFFHVFVMVLLREGLGCCPEERSDNQKIVPFLNNQSHEGKKEKNISNQGDSI